MTASDAWTLIADIGGTNARFGLLDADLSITDERTLRCRDHASFEDAATAYLKDTKDDIAIAGVAVCAAGPVSDGALKMTNHPWVIYAREIQRALGVSDAVLANDFEALAHAVPALTDNDVELVSPGEPVPSAPSLIVGPGSGLGAATWVPGPGGGIALSGEAGHMTASARADQEQEILNALSQRFGHVSYERLVSGPGLENIHNVLSDGGNLRAAEITARALAADDQTCVDTVNIFTGFLGSAISDMALSVGARGGVYLAGGILPRLQPMLQATGLVARARDKGRFSEYMAAIPIALVTHPYPAFLGMREMIKNGPHP